MSDVVKKVFVVLFACLLQVASAATVEEARAQALSSTNFWGVSFTEYRSRIGESVPFLATNGTQSARQALCDWYVSLAGLSSPTNSVASYGAWLDEQGMALSAYSRFLVDPQFTNAWMAAACCLGALRDAIPAKDDLRMDMKNRLFVEGRLVDDDTVREIREDFLRKQDFVFARQSVSGILARPVVDVFGLKGIPMLPIEERSAFASNYVSTARLSTEEANAVFQELSR
ncbi:MAG: hypothetical protein IKJ89_02985 [Kiritimatiellae bacterium]|nr:hypothetical protein [Kiritimatiellia bacterium]